jgi:hypothetical protein
MDGTCGECCPWDSPPGYRYRFTLSGFDGTHVLTQGLGSPCKWFVLVSQSILREAYTDGYCEGDPLSSNTYSAYIIVEAMSGGLDISIVETQYHWFAFHAAVELEGPCLSASGPHDNQIISCAGYTGIYRNMCNGGGQISQEPGP